MAKGGVSYLLRGGIVYGDDSSASPLADVRICDGVISQVGTALDPQDDMVVDCAGRLIMPGFIDSHSHVDGLAFDPEIQMALLRQGITTALIGQDGVSYAPGDGRWASRYFAAINGRHPHYEGTTVAALLGTYDNRVPFNIGYLTPAGTVRHEVLAMDLGPADSDQTAQMQQLVAQSMTAGSLGLSTGLDYVPNRFAQAAEMAALCRPVAASGGVHVSHMRGGYELNSRTGLEELALISSLAGVRTHVSHLHVPSELCKAILDDLAAAGTQMTYDMYPYTRGCSLLAMSVLPPRFSAMDPAQAVAELASDSGRLALISEWFPQVKNSPSLGEGWEHMITIGHTPAPQWHFAPGMTLAQIADKTARTREEVVMDILIDSLMEVNAVMAVANQRSDEELSQLLADDRCMPGSDGIFVGAAPHPRAFGTFPETARILRAFAGLSWAQIAEKFSALPVRTFNLGRRGQIREGFVADVVVVDPSTYAATATYEQPRALARGIEDVFVAGKQVLRAGNLTGELPGRGLRRSTSTAWK